MRYPKSGLARLVAQELDLTVEALGEPGQD